MRDEPRSTEVNVHGTQDGDILLSFLRAFKVYYLAFRMERRYDPREIEANFDQVSATNWRELGQKKELRLILDAKLYQPPRQASEEGVAATRAFRSPSGPGSDRGTHHRQLSRHPSRLPKQPRGGRDALEPSLPPVEVEPSPEPSGTKQDGRKDLLIKLTKLEHAFRDLPDSPFLREQRERLQKQIAESAGG